MSATYQIKTDEPAWTCPHYGEIYQVPFMYDNELLGKNVAIINIVNGRAVHGFVRMIERNSSHKYMGLVLDVNSIFAGRHDIDIKEERDNRKARIPVYLASKAAEQGKIA